MYTPQVALAPIVTNLSGIGQVDGNGQGPLVQAPAPNHQIVDYSEYTKGELEMLLVQRDQDKQHCDREKSSLTHSRDWYKKRCVSLAANARNLENALVHLHSRVNFRPNRNVTDFGGYSLALSRNIAHASARATALMVAGGPERGAVKDAHTVLIYENRVEAAKQIIAREAYAAVDANFEVHCHKCDATGDEPVDRNKVHVSKITSLSIDSDVLAMVAPGTDNEIEVQSSVVDARCAFKEVALQDGVVRLPIDFLICKMGNPKIPF